MFSEQDKTRILKLKSSIASYYNLTMKKIGDHQLQALFFENCVISGGCISSLFHDEPVKDIDIYPTSSKSLTLIKDYIINGGKNIKQVDRYDDESDVADKPYPLITNNAVTLTNDIQFIYMGVWEDCKTKFDFIHCQPHYDLATQKLYISEAQYHAIKNKILIPTGKVEIKVKRIEKYQKRGWVIENEKIVVSMPSAPFSWSNANIPGFVAQDISQIIPAVIK